MIAHSIMNKNAFIIAGSSNTEFAEMLSQLSSVPLARLKTGRFSNGEAQIRVEEEIYGKTFYIVQSLSMPVDEHIMELCLIVDALRRGGAEKIVAVVPWFGYGMQDKVFMPGEALSSKVVIEFLQSVGIHSIVTIDIHSDNIIGFFEVPVVHTTAIPLFAEYIVETYGKDVLVVSPDFGGAKRARRFAIEMGQEGTIGVIDKERSLTKGDIKLRGINMNVKGKTIVVPDDFTSTGGTLVDVVRLVKDAGAKKVVTCITHPLLSKNAAEKIGTSDIDEFVTSDTVVIPKEKRNHLGKKLHTISAVPLVAPYLGM